MHQADEPAGAQNTEVARPQASRRDPAELRQRLQAWLRTRLPSGADPRISSFEVPASNGMSSETVLFEAIWREGNTTQTQSLAARVAPDMSAVPVFPVYDLDRQFQVMQLVAASTSVPVPALFWCETDSRPLGAPFFVMQRIDGQVPPDVMPYNFGSWLSEASIAEQRRLQDSTVRVLAQLHGMADAERRFAFLSSRSAEPTALRRHVAELWSYY